MNFKARSQQAELIDQPGISASHIARNMVELNTINTWLGGHRITLKGFSELAQSHKEIQVCELGCGGGDNLRAIARWCQKRGITLLATGIDINEQCIAFAKEKNADLPQLQWICSDYRVAKIDPVPDIIFSSLFCHHFSNQQLTEQLKWMHSNSRLGFFINDLHRHWLAFYSIRLLTSIFSKSYLVKNDAPISVTRGFRKREWNQLLHEAGLKDGKVQWKWAFRHLVMVKKKK